MDLATGDVILYCGRHPLHVRQQELTSCPWAQVGLILRLPGVGACAFESTKLSECIDVWSGSVIRGVQVVRLADRIGAFSGRIAFRRLEPRLPGRAVEQLGSYAARVHALPFNDSKWTAVRAFRRKNPESSRGCFFCSELVAEAYQQVGLLPAPPEGLPSSNYIPADFSSSYATSVVRLNRGFRMLEEYPMAGRSGLAQPEAGTADSTPVPSSIPHAGRLADPIP